MIRRDCLKSVVDSVVRDGLCGVLHRPTEGVVSHVFPTWSAEEVRAFADPVLEGAGVREHLVGIAVDRETDPSTLHILGGAASAIWSDDLAMRFLPAAVDGIRAQGRVGVLVHALVTYAWAAVHTANAAIALPAAEEASRLARETDQLRWVAAAQTAEATIAAERGHIARAEALAAEAEQILVPIGAYPLLSLVQLARGRAALADGRHGDAYHQLARIFDPGDVAYQPLVRPIVIADLAEAAAQIGRQAEARLRVQELERDMAGHPAPILRATLSLARPVLADGDTAGLLYEAGLETDLGSWPCHRARLWLGYGIWLRRERRVAESRAPLRAARETFDAIGYRPWADRARQELRAAGEPSRRAPADTLDQLTPQEFQIAKLAAGGLSNREIGQQLFLSHRTVGSHLYRIFPKLGITSRYQLREALDLPGHGLRLTGR